MVYQAERKIKFHPDTSRNLHSYTVVQNGRRYLQTEEPFVHELGFNDYRVKKFRHEGRPPEVSFRLGIGLAPTEFFFDNIENPLFQETVKKLMSRTELTLNEMRVSLKLNGRDLFSIFSGMPAILFKSENTEQMTFEPEKQLFGYWFDMRSPTPEMPDVRVSLAMVYDLMGIDRGYLFGTPFGSDEFYKTVRPSVDASLKFDPIPK